MNQPKEPFRVIDAEGREVPILGKLKLTDDGHVIGDGATIYTVANNWRDGVCVTRGTASVDCGELDTREVFADIENAAKFAKKQMPVAPNLQYPAKGTQ